MNIAKELAAAVQKAIVFVTQDAGATQCAHTVHATWNIHYITS